MSISQEKPTYIPLNNPDLPDEDSMPDTGVPEGCLFDESLDDLTLDERYNGASDKQLRNLTREAFYEGFAAYRTSAVKLRKSKPPLRLLPETERFAPNELVERALPYIVWHVWKRHLLHNEAVSALDRVQNGSLYAIDAAQKYDPSHKEASFIGMFSPFLKEYIFRPEHGGIYLRSDLPINQSDLIRVPHPKAAYYHVKEFRRGRSVEFGREVEAEELAQLSNFSEEELQEYEDYSVEHIPFHRLEEHEYDSGVAFSDDFIDDDPDVDPYRATIRAMPSEGITTALNQMGDTQSAVVVAKLGLNGRKALSGQEIMTELGLSRTQIHSYYYNGLSKFRRIVNIEEIVEGTETELAGTIPESSSESQQSLNSAEDSPIVLCARTLLNGPGGVLSGLGTKGISKYTVLDEAGLHPLYQEGKLNGRVFMADDEAERLINVAGAIAQRRFHLSLYELAPSRSFLVDTMFKLLAQDAE